MGPSERLSPITSARAENDFNVFIRISGKIIHIAPPGKDEVKRMESRTRCLSRRKKKENKEETPRCRGVPFSRLLLLRSGGVFLVECLDEFRHFLNNRPGGVNVARGK